MFEYLPIAHIAKIAVGCCCVFVGYHLITKAMSIQKDESDKSKFALGYITPGIILSFIGALIIVRTFMSGDYPQHANNPDEPTVVVDPDLYKFKPRINYRKFENIKPKVDEETSQKSSDSGQE